MNLAPILAALLLTQRGIGGSTAEFLFPSDPLAPYAVALGNAGVALTTDGEANVNPAGIARTKGLSAYRYAGFSGLTGVAASGSVTVFNQFSLAITGRRFVFDEIVVDIPGATELEASEEAFALIGAASLGFVRVGGSVSRQFVNTFGSVTDATSLSVGVIAQPWRGGALGLAVRDLGGPARSPTGGEYPLPTRVRAGAAQEIILLGRAITLAADVELRTERSGDPGASVGVEVPVAPAFRLRGGVESVPNGLGITGSDVRWSFGLGLRVGPLDLGVAARFGGLPEGHETFIGIDAFR
ncbi:MAG: hypothetical protein ACREN5_05425 [Gemmatimonadales bacterium]